MTKRFVFQEQPARPYTKDELREMKLTDQERATGLFNFVLGSRKIVAVSADLIDIYYEYQPAPDVAWIRWQDQGASLLPDELRAITDHLNQGTNR